MIDDMEQTQYLSRNYENEIFEFHEMRSMIYFHSARNLIFGGRKEGRRISGVMDSQRNRTSVFCGRIPKNVSSGRSKRAEPVSSYDVSK